MVTGLLIPWQGPDGYPRGGKKQKNYQDITCLFLGLTIVDSKHIVLVNDNNFPYSSGRTIGKPDDNEFTLLNIEALVNAK